MLLWKLSEVGALVFLMENCPLVCLQGHDPTAKQRRCQPFGPKVEPFIFDGFWSGSLLEGFDQTDALSQGLFEESGLGCRKAPMTFLSLRTRHLVEKLDESGLVLWPDL